MKAGDVITEDAVRSVRPGFGLAPKFLDEVIGKKVKVDTIVKALLNRYGVTHPRCTQCTICGRSPCSDSKIP